MVVHKKLKKKRGGGGESRSMHLDNWDWKTKRNGAVATSLSRLFQTVMVLRKKENFL